MARSRSRSPRERGRQYSRSPDGRDYRDYRKGRHGDEGDRYRESDGRDYGRREHDSRRPDYRSRREESDRFGRRDERSSRSHGEPSSRPREDRRDWRDRDARRDWRDGARAREDGSPRPRWRRSNDGDPPDLAQTGRPSPRRDAPDPAAASQQDPKQPPLSLEELLKRRQAEQATAARPVFLSAEQRAEQALARRREEADAQRARVAVAREEAAREARRDGEGETRNFSNGTVAGGESEAERAALLDSIKQQYLGGRAEKKRPVKASERFKFVFDWDASEDTSRDANPLYARQQEAALLFGRGFRAGVDRREQRRAAAAGESALQERRRGRGEAGEDAGEERGGVEGSGYERGDMAASAHWSGKTLAEMTERDWRIFREDFSISYKGSHAAPPLRSWSEAVLPESLLRAVEAAGYVTPSPIQRAAIPLGLAQRDVIGVAETGSGKTCAFVLPMLAYVLAQPELAGHPEREAEGPYAVVLAPTRELAQQIEEETKNLARFTPTRVVSVVGGQSIEEQGFALRKGCEVLVATPGRLVDALGRSYAVLNQCNYVVLDEADRMIDLGFEPQVVGVLDAMPASNLKPEADDAPLERDRVYRTTYMFSATMPPAVERLARSYLRRPVVVTIGRAGKATENVQQHVLVCKENEKAGLLEQQLGKLEDDARVIVFVNTKRACDAVAKQLAELDFRATLLHGGKTQDQREDSIRGFREDRFNVLVATDVAGRGIDVPNVALVVNYDMPHTIEYYTHRIGRTGRAGRKGVAVTFLTLGDTDVYYDLRKFLEDNGVQVPRALAQHEASKNKPGALGGPPRRDAIQYAKK